MIANRDTVAMAHAAEGIGQRLHAASIAALPYTRRLETPGLQAVPPEKVAQPRIAGTSDAVACRVGGQELAAGHPGNQVKFRREPTRESHVIGVIVRDDDAPGRVSVQV